MNVFVDYHHSALFYSLQLLLEKRLNAKVYRPIGLEWYDQGYWKVYDHPHTANQFLGIHQASKVPLDIYNKPLPESQQLNLRYSIEDGIYYVKDLTNECNHRAVTLDRFKDIKFDIIISSIPQHIDPYNLLINKFQQKAKHIFQVGNSWGHQPGVKNILASTAPFSVPAGINVCFYHQEFDLDLFDYKPPCTHNVVHSYIHYMQKPELMDQYASHFPGWQWIKFGGGMDSSIPKASLVAKAMEESAFTWHYKPEGDGFGHVIHNTFAVGRPALVWKPHYAGRLAETLMVDGQTCLDLSCRNFEANIRAISRASEPAEHARMCKAVKKRFDSIVNFDDQFENQIKPFLERLR